MLGAGIGSFDGSIKDANPVAAIACLIIGSILVVGLIWSVIRGIWKLRYAFGNSGNFSLYMIKQGYAYEYTYGKPYKYQKEFKEAQVYAQESNGKFGI